MDLLLLQDQNRIFEAFVKKTLYQKKIENNNNNNLSWSEDSFLKKL